MTQASSGEGTGGATNHDAHDLGPRFEKALLEACKGQLTDLHWFRSDWQYGGAATAFATYNLPESPPRSVVVKFPVGEREYRVLTGLAEADAPSPRLAFHGESLNHTPLLWVVMERLPGTPAAAHLHKEVLPHLIDAAVAFYKVCDGRIKLDPPKHTDWPALLERARQAIHDNPTIPHAAEWAAAVRHVMKSLPRLLTIWDARTLNAICHGDLHPGNCMERPEGSPWGEPGHILFDFAESHKGHWVEDAVYIERMYWARPKVLDGIKPVTMFARARRAQGLTADDDYMTLANVRRALMAATSPAFLETEGSRPYMAAALETLDGVLKQFRI
ncbi:MAG: aminoglycoside phosphotransferase family protein [Phycisphaerae bacterium]|nr:aminoglycoside phosphotransferase family protein [Phycisphaerae bacterium]